MAQGGRVSIRVPKILDQKLGAIILVSFLMGLLWGGGVRAQESIDINRNSCLSNTPKQEWILKGIAYTHTDEDSLTERTVIPARALKDTAIALEDSCTGQYVIWEGINAFIYLSDHNLFQFKTLSFRMPSGERRVVSGLESTPAFEAWWILAVLEQWAASPPVQAEQHF